jgi:hypothetical protein
VAAEIVAVAGVGRALAPMGRRVKESLGFAGARRTGANASAADHPVRVRRSSMMIATVNILLLDSMCRGGGDTG